MKAVVLAAGRGVRLQPFTLTKPKHMLPVGGVPLLGWILEGLKEAQVEEVLIITHYMEEKIKGYFGKGSKLGLKIRYVKQLNMQGTADALNQAETFVEGEEFLAVYGDLYLSPDNLRTFSDAHRKGEVTMAVVLVENPSQYGVVNLEGDVITEIVEKPKPREEPSNLANAGLYVFTPEIFEWIKKTELSKRGEYEVTDSLEMMIKSGSLVRAVHLPQGDWIDVGFPWSLLDANERALLSLNPSIEGDVEKGAYIKGPVKVCKGAKVRSGSYIEGPVFIGGDSDIGPNCYIRPKTSIGCQVRIGNACEVKNSIIMDGTHIAHLSYVGDSIIGEQCNLGAGTIAANIRFDKKTIKVVREGGAVDTGRRKLGALIGDNVQTGINVSLMPGVCIGPDVWISPGMTVYRDLPAGTVLPPSKNC